MSFNFASKVKSDFESQLLEKQGEYVLYYSYVPTSSYSDEGCLLTRTEPTPTRVKAIIATFTQKDKQEYDLGNISVDDHKAYIPTSITPVHGDEIERSDGERYEVLEVLHEHAIKGVKTFYTVHIRRRTNVS